MGKVPLVYDSSDESDSSDSEFEKQMTNEFDVGESSEERQGDSS